jgi:hypothetical protein
MHLVQLRDTAPSLIELFVDGTENALPDSGRLHTLGLGSGAVVFMLQRLGWRWDECGSDITLAAEGLVATYAEGLVAMYGTGLGDWHVVTGGEPMTEGRHYWEVELESSTHASFMLGAVRPGLCLDQTHEESDDAYYIWSQDGSLFGNGRSFDYPQDVQFMTGDRIGVLLDLDAGWLRFYRNDRRCGPGFTEGVTGPLVRAAQLCSQGSQVKVLPGAVAPEGAGAADEPWEALAPESESESE